MIKSYLSESRKTLWLSLPFIANQILQMSVITIDTLMAGADSKLTLAAVAQGSVLWHFVVLGIIGVLAPMTAMFARAHARNDQTQLRELFQQSMWLALPLGLLGMVVLWWIPSIMHIVGVDEDIIPPATDYLRIICFGIPCVALFLPVRFITEGMGNPTAMMILTATSIPINIIGNYVLINGLFGLPKMGASGIAIATLVAEIYLLIVGWWFVLRHKKMRPLALISNYSRPLLEPIRALLRLGLPSSLMLMLETGMFTTVILLSGKLGVDSNAATQVAFNYVSNIFMVPLGLSMALTTRIGMAMGENDRVKVRVISLSGITIGAVFMCISVVGIIFFGESIAQLYSDEKSIITLATSLLAIAGIFQISDGIQVCATGVLRGLEETKAPMYYAMLGYWVLGIPLAILLAFPCNMGAHGLWYGLLLGLSTTAFLCARKCHHLTQFPKEATNAQ